MKKCFVAAIIVAFGIVNAQEAAAPAHAAEHAAPAPVAAPAHVTAPAPVAVPAPVAAPAHPVAVEPAAPAPEPIAEAPVMQPAQDTNTVVLVIQEQPAKKKKRAQRAPKNDFAVVDVPANFEIQARKVMPVDSDGWGTDNLDTWWGRANLMVLTESENFIGKLHLRMYPGEFSEKKTYIDDGSSRSKRGDYFQLYEAWAWHRGDYVNIKIGRWDNTTRFGSKAFGGYVDAKKDKDIVAGRNVIRDRQAGFMSTYAPESMVQFGLNNFSENLSLDIALISSDENLNRGDLRTYFRFNDLAGLENMEIGVGYRSNVFDGIYDKTTDVTHTVSVAARMPVVKDIGILKNLGVFFEAALIGLDDQEGTETRADGGSVPSANNPAFPVLGGLDIALYRGLDKIVIEAEYDGRRRNKAPCFEGEICKAGSTDDVRDIQGSIYVQKILNDRFTLNLGVQSEHNTKDFSFAARLQGRIN
ncbi:MAG: hypothetical protein FWC15_06085 [Fibromonadales bacterium]|nr:hypothetical protein [Fibromonadales bacterium]